MTRKQADDSGMSAIELIVAAAVSALLLGVIAVIFAISMRVNYYNGLSTTDVQSRLMVSTHMQESAKHAVRMAASDNSGVYQKPLNLWMQVQRPEDPEGVFTCQHWRSVSDANLLYSNIDYREWRLGETPPSAFTQLAPGYISYRAHGSPVKVFEYGAALRVSFVIAPKLQEPLRGISGSYQRRDWVYGNSSGRDYFVVSPRTKLADASLGSETCWDAS